MLSFLYIKPGKTQNLLEILNILTGLGKPEELETITEERDLKVSPHDVQDTTQGGKTSLISGDVPILDELSPAKLYPEMSQILAL